MREEPNLGDMLGNVWRAKAWLFLGGLAGIVASVLFLFMAVPHYKAEMLVAPATRSGAPDISLLFPDTASFAVERVMQNFGLGESSDFTRFEVILREPRVAGILLEDEKIRAGLEETGRFWIGEYERPDSGPEFSAWLQKRLSIEPVGGSRLRRISFQHADPAFAVYFLNRLYHTADSLIRSEIRLKTGNRVDWLKEALANTSHPEHRRVLTDLLMDQERMRMILAVDEPFSALLAEPPAVSAKPYWPKPSFVFPAFMLAGMVLAYAAFSLKARKV